ncbi:MAG: hypothetical protein KGQ59_09390, partial [Bdellovibrionales bacterium]|nr:hypothetical protein [Bdellovibrionales bacterium]
VIIDANGLQAFGRTEQILGIEPLVDKWRDFGFLVAVAENGQSFESLQRAYHHLEESSLHHQKPKCLIARTTKGGRISFMRNQMEWHYLTLSQAHLQQALSEISNDPAFKIGGGDAH